MPRIALRATLIAHALVAPALAQLAPAPTAEFSTVQRVEIVASSSDDDQRRRASIAKSVYGREELDRNGDIDLSDVLRRLPGITVDNGNPALRGLGGGYTQVLINGEPAPPGFSMDSLGPGDVEKIEVIKGSTAEYSGVAGTINVVLREPLRTRQTEFRGNLGWRAGITQAGTNLQWNDGNGEFSYVLPVSVRQGGQSTTFETIRTTRDAGMDLRMQSISGKDAGQSITHQFSPRLQWKSGVADTITASALLQVTEPDGSSERRIDTLTGLPGTASSEHADSRGRQQLSRLQWQWQHKAGAGGRLEFKGSHQELSSTGLSHYTAYNPDENPILQRDTHAVTGESRRSAGGRWHQPLGDDHSLSVGLDLEQRERSELRRVWENDVERSGANDGVQFASRLQRSVIFVQDEWALGDSWSALPGLRFEQIATRSKSSLSPATDGTRQNLTNPSLHVNYRLDPKGKDQVRASLARSIKLPELGSLFPRYSLNATYDRDSANTPVAADRAGNPQLAPEHATGLDLAYEHVPAGGGVLSISAFSRRIENLIRSRIALESVADASVPRWVSRPANIGRARSHGVEFEIKGRSGELLPGVFGSQSGLNLRASLNRYVSHVEQVDGPENRLEAQLPWSATLGVDGRVPATVFILGGNLVLKPAYVTQQTDRQRVARSAAHTLDLFVAWRPDRSLQFRLAATTPLHNKSVIESQVDDLDGFAAGSVTSRSAIRSVNASLVARF